MSFWLSEAHSLVLVFNMFITLCNIISLKIVTGLWGESPRISRVLQLCSDTCRSFPLTENIWNYSLKYQITCLYSSVSWLNGWSLNHPVVSEIFCKQGRQNIIALTLPSMGRDNKEDVSMTTAGNGLNHFLFLWFLVTVSSFITYELE